MRLLRWGDCGWRQGEHPCRRNQPSQLEPTSPHKKQPLMKLHTKPILIMLRPAAIGADDYPNTLKFR
jgi:hypothetical protein